MLSFTPNDRFVSLGYDLTAESLYFTCNDRCICIPRLQCVNVDWVTIVTLGRDVSETCSAPMTQVSHIHWTASNLTIHDMYMSG